MSSPPFGWGLLTPGEPVLAAVSGGGDSVAMLVALARRGQPTTVCHVDHGVRPGSGRDARWVEGLCQRLGVAVHTRRLPGVRADEASLRSARYAALARVANELGIGTVATGHTLDDQAETVVLRLLRGTGLVGLGGIPPARTLAPGLRVVRPLLQIRRAVLREWLGAHGESWLDDPTNVDGTYLRSRVRAAGLPLSSEVLAAVADAARAATRLLDALAADALEGAGQRLDLPRLASWPRPVRAHALRVFVGGCVGRRHLEALERLASGRAGSAELHLPDRRVVRREYGVLSVRRRAEATPAGQPWSVEVTAPGRVRLPSTGIVLTFSLVDRDVLPLHVPDAREAWFDAMAVRFPLTVRGRRAGDRVRPLGGPGSRKLKRVLIDARVPRRVRDRLPIVVSGDDVLWVAGVVRGHGAPVGSGTRTVLRVRAEKVR